MLPNFQISTLGQLNLTSTQRTIPLDSTWQKEVRFSGTINTEDFEPLEIADEPKNDLEALMAREAEEPVEEPRTRATTQQFKEKKTQLTISAFDPSAHRQFNRISPHELFQRKEDNRLLEDEVHRISARIQKMRQEQQQAEAEMHQIDIQMEKIDRQRQEKQAYSIVRQMAQKERNESLQQLREKNALRENKQKQSVIERQLQLIQTKKQQAAEIRLTSKIAQTRARNEMTAARQVQTQKIKQQRLEVPTWQGVLETKLERMKEQHYANEYATIQKTEDQRDELVRRLMKAQQEERRIALETLKAKEKRTAKAAALDQFLQSPRVSK